MKSINKLIKEKNLEALYIFDEASDKGNPTKNSIVLTFVIDEKKHFDSNEYTIGIALKLPNDEFIPRVGKAIAYRNMNKNQFRVVKINAIELYELLMESFKYFDLTGKKLNKAVLNRLRNLFFREFSEFILSNERN